MKYAIKCKYCDYETISLNIVRKHVLKKHPEKYDGWKKEQQENGADFCLICDVVFVNSSSFQEHMMSQHTLRQMRNVEVPTDWKEDSKELFEYIIKNYDRPGLDEHVNKWGYLRHDKRRFDDDKKC